ncbi:MAG: UDP-N-acetylmuramoyl-tripeptide--D-alanyl-D-alanine ligase [Calditrichaeota bacterium]|nr:MAG: UDP-N-acetylmuramoyl-tripeptide--D-alanyl-D-alanine ligase [Calditrichota bacterium]
MSDVLINDLDKIEGFKMLNTESLRSNKEFRIDLSTDSRTLKSGQTYLAIRGEQFDGHDFIEQVFLKGAQLAIVDSEFIKKNMYSYPLVVVPDTIKALQKMAAGHRDKFKIPIIGLTGSNGKTTTKEMIAHVLGSRFNVHKTNGNLNNHIGCPLTVLGIKTGHEAAVIEMGTNHPGEIDVLADIVRPDHSLITNIGEAHIEFFGSKKAIFKEKKSVFDSTKPGGKIYINLDDPFLSGYQHDNCVSITYSMKVKADIMGRLNDITPMGFPVFTVNDKTKVRLQTAGIHNALNALSAFALAMQFGMTENEIKDALESFISYDKRLQISDYNGIMIINDAYNSNPDSVAAVLDSVRKIKIPGRKIIALGDMFELGKFSAEAHIRVVKMAVAGDADELILLGNMMTDAGRSVNHPKIKCFEDHAVAADYLNASLEKGDLLLLKGSRGMAMEKILDIMGISQKQDIH